MTTLRRIDKRMVVAVAESLVTDPPIPWKRGGRDRDGMDCFGVVVVVYHKLGLPIPDPMTLEREEILNSAVCEYFTEMLDRGMTGDVMRWLDRRGQSHVGVVVGEYLLNATHRHGVVIERIAPLRRSAQKLGPVRFYRYTGAPVREAVTA